MKRPRQTGSITDFMLAKWVILIICGVAREDKFQNIRMRYKKTLASKEAQIETQERQ